MVRTPLRSSSSVNVATDSPVNSNVMGPSPDGSLVVAPSPPFSLIVVVVSRSMLGAVTSVLGSPEPPLNQMNAAPPATTTTIAATPMMSPLRM